MTKKRSDIAKLTKHYGSFYEFFIKGEASLRFWESIASGASLVNSFLILSFLSVYQFGLYQLILAFIALAGGFSLDQFDGAISIEMRYYFNRKEKLSARRIFSEYVVIKLLLAIFLTLAVFLGSSLVADHYGSDIGLFIKIASILLLIDAALSIEKIFLKSIFSFAFFGVTAVRELAKLILLVFFVFWGVKIGIANILTVHLLGWLTALVFLSVFFVRRYKKVFVGSGRFAGKYLLIGIVKTYGKLVMVRYSFARLTKNFTPWMIKFFVNTEAVGLYSLAVNLIAFIEELFPINMLSYIFQANIEDRGNLRRIFNRSVKYAFWFGVIAAVISLISMPILIGLILPKYTPVLSLFKLMLIALPVFGVYKIFKWLLTALREYKILAMRTITEAVVIFSVLVVSLPTVGLLGAGLAYIAIYLARVLFLYPALVKSHPYLRFDWSEMVKLDQHDRNFMKNFFKQIFFLINRLTCKLKLKNKSNVF